MIGGRFLILLSSFLCRTSRSCINHVFIEVFDPCIFSQGEGHVIVFLGTGELVMYPLRLAGPCSQSLGDGELKRVK